MTARPSRRPRFELVTELAPEEMARRFKAFLAVSKRVRGIALTDRIELGVTGDEHHFWSPQLVVVVSARASGGANLSARFGPDPYVWAMYLLMYGTLILVTLIASAFGFAQWTLGMQPSALYVAPASLVLALLVSGASFVGQGLGSDQMYLLRSTLTELAVAVALPEPHATAG